MNYIDQFSKNMFMSEPTTRMVFDIMSNTSVALIGIGDISSNPDILPERLLSQEDLNVLIDSGVVSNICCSFLNREGEVVNTDYTEDVIGIRPEKLKEIPFVIGAAKGKRKALPVSSALNGSWIHALVLDTELAKELIRIRKEL